MKLDRLTKEQEDLMPTIVKKWTDKALRNTNGVDLDALRKGAAFLYELAKLPPPEVLVVASPLGVQYAAHLMKKLGGGANVRDNVWDNFGANVRANVAANVWANVGANVWDNVGANVRDNVSDNVSDNVWANVRDNVSDNVSDNVRANVEANVRANVVATIKDSSITFEPFAYSSIMWSGWVAFYEFFTQIGVLNDDKFNRYVEYLNAGGTFTVMMDKILVTCPCPTKIYVDDQQRLHSDQFATIEWADGYAQWYLDGVSLTHEIWSKIVTHEMTFAEIMAIEDADVRAVALKYNQNAIIADGAELIDEHPTAGELFLIRKRPINKLVNKPNIYFLRMKCQSTGRVFVEAVDPDYAKQNPYALHCQAKAFGVSPEIYGQLQQRNMG